MAQGVEVSEQHRQLARQGYFLQKESLPPEEFDKLQIEVIASLHAYIDMLTRALHHNTFELGVYAPTEDTV
jgi:hypothetical protein